MSEPKRIAYVRTSPADLPEERSQLEWAADVDKWFIDELVGPNDHRRPQRRAALEYLHMGDTLVLQSMERLARTGDELSKVLTNLNERGVAVEFVAEALTLFPCKPAQRDRELALIRAGQTFIRSGDAERQRVGIKKAVQAKRKYNGRPMKLTERKVVDMKARLRNLGRNPSDSITKIAEDFGVSRQTVYTYEKAIDALVVAAGREARAKRQRARGSVEKAKKTKADAIVKRRAAFESGRSVSIAEVRAARLGDPPDDAE